MKNNICKHWRDYCEPDIGLNEYCNAVGKACTCSGAKGQCDYIDHLKTEKEEYNV